MTRLRSNDEPVGRMAKLMAELYYFMAKEMVERMGEELGKEAIRAAITEFGKARLQSMYEEAGERKLALNLETYLKVRDMPGISWERDPDNPDDIIYCPMQDTWAELGDQELGQIYCEIDDILYNGFNTELNRPLCKTKGDSCCRFITKARNEEANR
jgi:hypothetical protein